MPGQKVGPHGIETALDPERACRATVLHGYEARRGGDAIPPTRYVI